MDTCYRSPKSYPLSKGIFNLAGTLNIPDTGSYIFGLGFSKNLITGISNISKLVRVCDEAVVFDSKGILINAGTTVFDDGEEYKIVRIKCLLSKADYRPG